MALGLGGHIQNQNQGQGQNNQRENLSIWDALTQLTAFHLNPIFTKVENSQRFPSPFIKYKIIPYVDEKKALDVCSSEDKKKGLKKNNLIIWDYHAGPNQLWHFLEQSSGQFLIINISRGFVVKISEYEKDPDAPVMANPKTGNKN